MRPRTTCPSRTSANGASTACGARSANGPALEGLDQLGEVVVGVDAGVGLAGQLVGVEEVLLAEPRLDPGVEAGAEPGGRRRLPRHRPGQLAGERLGVGAQPRRAPSPTARSAAGRRPPGRGRPAPRRPAGRARRPSRRPARPRPRRGRRRGPSGRPRAPRARPRAAAPPRGRGRARATGGTGRRRRRGWGRPWRASPASAPRHRLAPGLELVADHALVGRRAEGRGPRAPEVRRHAEAVGGAGERDVAQPQLLLLVVGAGVLAVGVERGLVVAGQLRQVAGVAAQRGRQHGRARRSTACATGWTGTASRTRRPGTRAPTPGPWRGGRSAA